MNEKFTVSGVMHRLWWVPMLTGLVCLGFGIWCLLAPAESITVMAYIFTACLTGAGVLNLIYAALNTRAGTNWGWSMALGLLEIGCGVWLFTIPAEQLAFSFMFVAGIWILVVAINGLCEAAVMSRFSAGWIFWMVIMLCATLVFAFIFMSGPVAGGIAVWLWLGISLITYGAYRISLALVIRRANRLMR